MNEEKINIQIPQYLLVSVKEYEEMQKQGILMKVKEFQSQTISLLEDYCVYLEQELEKYSKSAVQSRETQILDENIGRCKQIGSQITYIKGQIDKIKND